MERPRVIDAVLIAGISYFVYASVLIILSGRVEVRLGTAIATVSLLGASYILTRLTVTDPLRYVGVRLVQGRVLFYTIVASFAVVLPVMSLQAILIKYLRVPPEEIQELAKLMHAESLPGLFYVWLVVALGTGLSEEFVFRGVLQNCLARRVKVWWAILIASLVFGALHTYRFPSAVLLGGFLGLIYWRTRSLVPAIVSHIIINSIALLLFFAFESQIGGRMPDWVMKEQPAPLWMNGSSLVVLAAVLVGLWKATPDVDSDTHEIGASKEVLGI